MGRPGFEFYSSCVELPRLLEQAVPRPRSVGSPDGGALLSLAAHCLMVHEGFTVVDHAAHKRTSIFNPPAGWNSSLAGSSGEPVTVGKCDQRKQWVFEYKYGSCGQFIMYCTLHDETGKMFVHARQADNEDNLQVLGLRLSHYIPQVDSHSSWDEVLVEEELLYDMFMEYIVRPLVGFAALGLQVCGRTPEPELRLGHRPSPEAQGRSSIDDSADMFYDSMDEDADEDLLVSRRPVLSRHSSGLDPKLVYMLNRTPPSLMLSIVLVTSAAATTAVLWAWRR
uniref:Uncharacterized protein n=1 Tax=Tetraselmis chuii TaxID=63592 RepID=A0A7S1SGF2_9CHLO|mmetsp:Transcript_10245/g.18510  ORF Transcript_10245/g.18510 Transcript_10245/m.18510 type:complete len:281 (+) Transcript_10245:621-1463(+)